MSLKQVLFDDMKQAMKDKDMIKKNTLQFVRSAILQEEKDKQIELDDKAIIEVIASQVKKRKASLPEFEKSGRTELVKDLNIEIDILMKYLPKQLSDEELEQLIADTISELGASSMKDMGKVMSSLAPKTTGRADNKKVSEIVKQKLNA